MVRAGVLLNPIAGFGGALALHGTDGLPVDRFDDAVRAGRAAARLVRALDRPGSPGGDLELVAAPGVLGSDALTAAGIPHTCLSTTGHPVRTTRADTIAAARRLIASGIDLLVFAGGDGTATDVAEAIGESLPVIGVPAGVKMHSEVFSRSPEAAGRLLDAVISGLATFESAEVLDVGASDETGVVGMLRAPRSHEPLQGAKTVAPPAASAVVGRAIAESLVPAAPPRTTWIVGPGATTGAVAAALGMAATLRGVDVLHPDGTAEPDVTEERLFAIVRAAEQPLLVLGVVGGQGFLLGRGNQQLSARVISSIGTDRIHILATEQKVSGLFPPVLLVDAEPDPDRAPHPLLGYRRVRTGPRQSTVLRVIDAAA
ncbi:ATP-NAD kinase family protein [Microbacterium sp.]|uniref:ATP-NAD kinase family protein n=1 Tax=Microbacterium sp. TaxID=51671 RepID=UPI003F7144E8